MKTNIFFTADHHFGHNNIIRFTERPFSDIETMNEELIKRWNRKVNPNDDVYHLGDFSLASPNETRSIFDRLNGKIHLIKGNHEKSTLTYRERFEWIKDYHEMYLDLKSGESKKVILMHYAMKVWNGSHRGNWQLYGHSHGTLPDENDRLQIDVGVDCHNFYPISAEEVEQIMSKKNWVSPFAPRN